MCSGCSWSFSLALVVMVLITMLILWWLTPSSSASSVWLKDCSFLYTLISCSFLPMVGLACEQLKLAPRLTSGNLSLSV